MEMIEESVCPKMDSTLRGLGETRMKNFTSFCNSLILTGNDFENDSNANDVCYKDVGLSLCPPGGDRSNTPAINAKLDPGKIQTKFTWLGGGENSTHVTNGKDSIRGENLEKFTERRKKTPKIEVRQEDFKTVVKISMKESPSPQEEILDGSSVLYENGRMLNGNRNRDIEFDPREMESIYENVNVSGENCYENVAHAVRRMGSEERVPCSGAGVKVGSMIEPEFDSRYDRVNGRDVRISKCESEKVKILIERDGRNVDEICEKVKSDCHLYENENLYRNGLGNDSKREGSKKSESETKSSFIEINLRKPKANGMKGNAVDENSSGDPFDSGTSSDVDTLPPFGQTKKENVRVTIKSFQGEEPRRTEELGGHGRAESLTSSGLGVDSEESDDEKSNISCDSLNGIEHYPQSNSIEDHGYHTPNFEDETPGSPVSDGIVYENVMKETGVPNVASDFEEKKMLQVDRDETPATKPNVQIYDSEEYEMVRGFEKLTCDRKRISVLPPNGSEPQPLSNSQQVAGRKVEGEEGVEVKEKENDQKSLPENLLCDIRSRNVRLSSTHPNGKSKEEMKRFIAETIFNLESDRSKSCSPSTTKFADEGKHGSVVVVEKKTYGDRKANAGSVVVNRICAIEVDTDRFYKFHLSENFREDKNGSEEETFAGIKDYLSREKPSAITSAKGTIRGVKNRVKAGIATFLQMHENKSYRGKDAGKVVVYTTTMGIVRETYQKCLKVKQILRTLMVKFEERDVFMCSEAQEEIRERMKCDFILVPQVFVEGQHIGDAETIERLNELGELRTILKPYQSPDACSTCKVCGGYRLLPCSVCKGSKKSVHRNHFTAEFVSLKCMHCDRVGLAKCHAC